MNTIMDKLKLAFKHKAVQVTGYIIFVMVLCLLSSAAAVKINTSNNKSVKVATDIVGQLSEQYLTPKFDALNTRLDAVNDEVKKLNEWTAKKDDRDYKSLVTLIDKQYEKYNKDRFDIKIADLKEIDENWDFLPDTYKTTMVKKEYDIAMSYYMSVKSK